MSSVELCQPARPRAVPRKCRRVDFYSFLVDQPLPLQEWRSREWIVRHRAALPPRGSEEGPRG